MTTKKFIKRLSPDVSLVGAYDTGSLWNLHLVATDPASRDREFVTVNDGLPSRRISHLGGFEAHTYVGLNLERYYVVREFGGTVVFRDQLTG